MRILLFAVALGIAPVAAVAAPVIGGETRVEFTADLPDLGLDTALIGTTGIVNPSPLTAAQLVSLFGLPDLTGFDLGLAATVPVFASVSEPAAAGLVALAVDAALLDWRHRRT